MSAVSPRFVRVPPPGPPVWLPDPARWPVMTWRAEHVRALREAMRLTVVQFSQELGMSARVVSRWEAGAQPRPGSQRTLDVALSRAPLPVQLRFTVLLRGPEPTDDNGAGGDGADGEDTAGWTISVHIDVVGLDAALAAADTVCDRLRGVPGFVAGMTTVSPADLRSAARHVYCDRRLPDSRRRCTLRPDHDGGCELRSGTDGGGLDTTPADS